MHPVADEVRDGLRPEPCSSIALRRAESAWWLRVIPHDDVCRATAARILSNPAHQDEPMDSLSLSPLSLFMQAGPVSRSVMILLLAASLWSWLVIAESLFSLARLSRALRQPRSLWLAEVDDVGAREAGERIEGESVSERRARVAETMTRAGLEILAKAEGGLANLAVIASVAPFVGLFGTVWGIMASFVGIAAARDTSLAVVAPGIAEALAATAYGLAAAIPASIGYNRIGAAFARAGQQLVHRAAGRAAETCRLADRAAP
jgi:biopolymer transport protein ExbB/TolQ